MNFCLVSIASYQVDVLLQNLPDRSCPQDSGALQSSGPSLDSRIQGYMDDTLSQTHHHAGPGMNL